MTTIQYATIHGSRQTAIKLIDIRLRSYGISFDDMPDSSERCDIIDQLEEEIQTAIDDSRSLDNTLVKSLLEEVVDEEFLLTQLMG